MNSRPPKPIGPKITFGLLMILAGVALVLQNLDILQDNIWHIFWPSALLLFGFSSLISRGPLHFGGHVLLFFGAAFLLANLGYAHIPDRWWPLGLVWGGLVLVLRALVKPEPTACHDADRGFHE